MHKTAILFAAMAFAVVGLTACGNESPTTSAPTSAASGPAAPASVSPTSSPSTAASAASTATGYIPKKVGERAGITNPDGTPAVEFWVTKIAVDPKCGQYMSRQPGKHTLLLDVTIKTQTDRADGNGLSTFSILPSLINPYAFSTTGSDGVTNQAETDTCVVPKALPSAYAPNRTYTGQIAIATTATTGTLQLTDGTGAMGPGAHGWEWSY